MSWIELIQKPLYIDFKEEDGDDFGGLTREFFSEVFKSAEAKIFQGPFGDSPS